MLIFFCFQFVKAITDTAIVMVTATSDDIGIKKSLKAPNEWSKWNKEQEQYEKFQKDLQKAIPIVW